MPSSPSLCTWAKSNLGDRVFNEVKKNSLIDLAGKGELLSKAVFDKVFYRDNRSRVRLLIRLRYVQGLCSFNLVSGSLSLESNADTFHLAGVLILKRGLKTLSCCPLRWNQNLPQSCTIVSWLLLLHPLFILSLPDEKFFDLLFGTQEAHGNWTEGLHA